MRKVFYLLLALFALAIMSCGKNDPQPDQIFRCKVNGADWKVQCLSDNPFNCDAIDCLYYLSDRGFEISAYNRNANQSIIFSCRSTIIGTNTIRYRPRAFKDFSINSNCGFYDLDTNKVHTLTILEIDTINLRIKGEFEFEAFDDFKDCDSARVTITEGYFDVRYRF